MYLDAMDITLCVEDRWMGFEDEQILAECFATPNSEDDEEIAKCCPNMWR